MPHHALRQLRAAIGRDSVRLAIRLLLDWPRTDHLQPGYSIILGVPWHLRHLTNVNLEFLSRTDHANLRVIHLVLDRVAPSELEQIKAGIPAHLRQLPLALHCYKGMAGRLIELADVSTFYNGMNCITALQRIDTKYAILHDFDLYPLVPDYFERMFRQMRERDLQFCGVELTTFDGLSTEDRVLGTWGLGMNVEWLRGRFAPVDILHRMRKIRGRPVSLDPFSDIQLGHDADRELVDGFAPEDFCHVKNLCSSFLRFSTGRRVTLAWRLHYLWYLESIAIGRDLRPITASMEHAKDLQMRVDGQMIDFSGTHPTCANVLESELLRMDRFLFGTVRSSVREFVDAFRRFLKQEPSPVIA